MQDLSVFKSHFGARFWRKLKDSLVPFEEIKPQDRDMFLTNLYSKIIRRDYQPASPREYIVSEKYSLVSRIVPTFSSQDYCVYFYCLKVLESFIADSKGRVPGTFGGWTLNNDLVQAESEEQFLLESLFVTDAPSAPDSSYNPLAWRKHWKQFQKLSYDYGQRGDFGYYIYFDIANFYDYINLELLEDKIRLATQQTNLDDEISLLFYFLRHWNKKFEGYKTKCIGLPQDEIQDCSRILANFYLRDYDKIIYELCTKEKSLYLRYADDQIIFCPTPAIAKKILFEASKELHKIGLNINAGKVKCFDNKFNFNEFWAFDIFELVEDEEQANIPNLEKAINIYFTRNKREFKYDSVLKRFLTCGINSISSGLKYRLLAELFDKEFLSQADSGRMAKIYNICTLEQKTEFFGILDMLAQEVRYNSFHYNLKKFYSKYRPGYKLDPIDKKIKELRF